MPQTGMRCGAVAAALALAGCGGLPLVGGSASDAGVAQLVENRVWLEEAPLVPGSFRAFLASGELVEASCWEVPRLWTWRWVDTMTLEWTGAEGRTRAEIVTVGPTELVLLVEGETGPVTRRLAAARAAGPC